MVWFPEYTKLVSTREYEAQTTLHINKTYNGIAFNTSVENERWIDSFFKNCSFHHLTFSHVSFDNCTIDDVRFEIIKSSRTYFRNSIIKDSRFDAFWLYISCYDISIPFHHHHHHHHQSFRELGHLLTRSSVMHPEVSLTVCHDFFCQLGNTAS